MDYVIIRNQDIKKLNKQHVLAYYWPSSGFILKSCSVRVLYNYTNTHWC